MNYLNKILLLVILIPTTTVNAPFKSAQLKFERVKNAYDEKWLNLQKDLEKIGITDGFELYMAAFKAEGKLELWLKPARKAKYQLFKTYDFCAHSGTLGPKVLEGDGQTPEGFYKINVFNPQSNFHLSLGIDYPNKVDLVRTGKQKNPGGEIYVHGNCVTIGCIPLTDDKIKEVYVLAVEARNGGQKEIPIHVFPFKLTDANLSKYGTQFPSHSKFWKNLQMGYALFEQYRKLPIIKQVNGKYEIS